jgi:hypothetical protein
MNLRPSLWPDQTKDGSGNVDIAMSYETLACESKMDAASPGEKGVGGPDEINPPGQ